MLRQERYSYTEVPYRSTAGDLSSSEMSDNLSRSVTQYMPVIGQSMALTC